PTPNVPVLSGEVQCMSDGSILFIITNSGADMPDAAYYTVTDANGGLVADGYVQLFAGEQFPLNYLGYDSLTFTMGDLVLSIQGCAPATPEPTPFDPPILSGSVTCEADGSIIFTISNTGNDMLQWDYYTITTPDGGFVADGWLQLFTGEQTALQYWGYERLVFTMGDLVIVQDAICPQPTPVPTEEVTPTPEPTQDVTPTAEPTQDVTPTAEPTEEFTPTPTPTDDTPLGCQKNNDGRLDCSSLQVTGTCEGGLAVFTIRNTGERGNGDMRTPTEYRIIVDGVVVEIGAVQLIGGAATQITYSGGGTVTLEADQQVGHPGQSQPQATVSCSA
ncbi:MAG: hypothetical protein K8I30_12750, partial [Anaerolineae bacterium]|nr:hypothetical protein [Anaerolineae bacterium]